MFALVRIRTFEFGCCDFAHEVCGLSLLCVLLNDQLICVKLLFLSLFLLLILFLLLLFFLF